MRIPQHPFVGICPTNAFVSRFVFACMGISLGVIYAICTLICVCRSRHMNSRCVYEEEGNLSLHFPVSWFLLFTAGSLIHLDLYCKDQASWSLSFERSASQPNSSPLLWFQSHRDYCSLSYQCLRTKLRSLCLLGKHIDWAIFTTQQHHFLPQETKDIHKVIFFSVWWWQEFSLSHFAGRYILTCH